jgi:hypothetical protein
MTFGKSVRLFLVDGSPTGLLTAEIMNWTGHILTAPRVRLAEALKRSEAGRTGVYFLSGDDPSDSSKLLVYIGEGDRVAERIKSHDKDQAKDFWTHLHVITSKDANLTKAHVRYLESRLVELAKSAGRANVANGTQPASKQLPESDVADMEFFLSQLQLALPLVGLDVIRPKLQIAPAADGSITAKAIELRLVNKKHGVEAKGIFADGDFVVLEGSKAVVKDDFSQNSSAIVRKKLIDEGVLTLDPNGSFYTFIKDAYFTSPSVAASVIMNSNRNGRVEWRLIETGQTLKDWQSSLLDELPLTDAPNSSEA